MASTEKLDTHHKALTLNLDASAFGSFAEIGAGQEVARWFLVVGGASGTVAKTISAYDKEVSDDSTAPGRATYPGAARAMLDREWSQLLTQLSKTRGPQTRFFSFVDTVSARNFAGTTSPRLDGLRFQLQPGPSQRRAAHINLLDPSNLLQQEAIGILGVNLIYSAFHELQTRNHFWKVWHKTSSRSESRSTTWISRASVRELDRRTLLAHLVYADLPRLYFSPRRPQLPRPRLSTRKPSCLRRNL